MEWRQVHEFKNYWVSDSGQLKTTSFNREHTERPINCFVNIRGYVACNLMMNGFRKRKMLHQLVALSFLPNPHNHSQVNHKNGIKTDNRVENLEWCSAEQNVRHSFETKLNVAKRDGAHHNSVFNDEEIIEIRKLRLHGLRLKSIGDMYGVDHRTIWVICNRKYEHNRNSAKRSREKRKAEQFGLC